VKQYTESGHCPDCGAHQAWGCRFGCPSKCPPAGPGARPYREWADEQSRLLMRADP
jgi:hypothetical protein